MMGKERIIGQAENIIKRGREDLMKRELVEYETRVSFQTAVLLRDAMTQVRVEAAQRVPGAYSKNEGDNPSDAEGKLSSALAHFEGEIIDEHDEIVVPLLGSDVDELNTTLFPALRPLSLVDSNAFVTIDGLIAINDAYKAAGGNERPSFIEGIKPYQI